MRSNQQKRSPRKDRLAGVAQSDDERQHGICLTYATRGVMPVATLGAECCRQWVR